MASVVTIRDEALEAYLGTLTRGQERFTDEITVGNLIQPVFVMNPQDIQDPPAEVKLDRGLINASAYESTVFDAVSSGSVSNPIIANLGGFWLVNWCVSFGTYGENVASCAIEMVRDANPIKIMRVWALNRPSQNNDDNEQFISGQDLYYLGSGDTLRAYALTSAGVARIAGNATQIGDVNGKLLSPIPPAGRISVSPKPQPPAPDPQQPKWKRRKVAKVAKKS